MVFSRNFGIFVVIYINIYYSDYQTVNFIYIWVKREKKSFR